MTNLNILEVYKQAFGHTICLPSDLRGSAEKLRAEVIGAFNLRSELAANFMFPLAFKDPETRAWWQLPVEPIISIKGSNKIIETPLNRGDRVSNVLEEINLNNYSIRIRGVLIGRHDLYPSNDVYKLRSLLEKRGSKEVKSPLLEIFNINKVAIKDVDWIGVPGQPELQAYRMRCISDEDFELELLNEE